MSKILIDELKRIRSILSAVTGFEDDDQEYVEDARRSVDQIIEALAEQPAQQEPVAWSVFDGPNLHDMFFTEEDAQDMARLKGDGSIVKPLYTTPQPAQRKPLTDDELADLWYKQSLDWMEFARAVEAAHGIKESKHEDRN